MALAIVTRALGTAHTSNSQTTSVTVANASPMIVAVLWVGGTTITSIAWNGTAMSLIGSTGSGAVSLSIALYGIKNPTPATGNLVINFSGAVDVGNAVIFTTSGGDTTTSWRSAYSREDGDGSGPGMTVVDSVNGDIVFHALGIYNTTLTWDAGETTTSTTQNNPAGTPYRWGCSTKDATGANTSVGATDVSFYAEVAVSVIPDSGGGGATLVHRNLLLGVGT